MKIAFWIFLTLSIVTVSLYLASPGNADDPDNNFGLIPISCLLIFITGIIGVGFIPRQDVVFFSSVGLGLVLFFWKGPLFLSPFGIFFLVIASSSGIWLLIKKFRWVARH